MIINQILMSSPTLPPYAHGHLQRTSNIDKIHSRTENFSAYEHILHIISFICFFCATCHFTRLARNVNLPARLRLALDRIKLFIQAPDRIQLTGTEAIGSLVLVLAGLSHDRLTSTLLVNGHVKLFLRILNCLESFCRIILLFQFLRQRRHETSHIHQPIDATAQAQAHEDESDPAARQIHQPIADPQPTQPIDPPQATPHHHHRITAPKPYTNTHQPPANNPRSDAPQASRPTYSSNDPNISNHPALRKVPQPDPINHTTGLLGLGLLHDQTPHNPIPPTTAPPSHTLTHPSTRPTSSRHPFGQDRNACFSAFSSYGSTTDTDHHHHHQTPLYPLNTQFTNLPRNPDEGSPSPTNTKGKTNAPNDVVTMPPPLYSTRGAIPATTIPPPLASEQPYPYDRQSTTTQGNSTYPSAPLGEQPSKYSTRAETQVSHAASEPLAEVPRNQMAPSPDWAMMYRRCPHKDTGHEKAPAADVGGPTPALRKRRRVVDLKKLGKGRRSHS